MFKKLVIGLTGLTIVSLGGGVALTTVHADKVPGEDKTTATEVTIIDSPDNNGTLKLIHVPEKYSFATKLQSTGQYTITGATVTNDANITIFNDKSSQDWSVKASIDNTELSTKDGKKATVTGFKINGQSLMGENANQVVYNAASDKTEANNTGWLSKVVTNDGLSVSFNNATHDLKAGDVLTGTVNYSLYNTPNAK